MKQVTLFCFVGFFATTTTTVRSGSNGDNLVVLAPVATIGPTPEKFQSTLGDLPGMRSCGGPAEVLDWRYEGCTGGDGTMCQIPSDGKKRKSEFSFIPSEPILGGLGVRFNVTADGMPSRFYEISVPNSAVRGGRVYTIKHLASPTKEFQGKTLTVQYIVFRQVDRSVEACAEVNVHNA